ncbi:MAG: c-type cytochrome domain-containing protein, partial [Bacteroidota bacterium]
MLRTVLTGSAVAITLALAMLACSRGERMPETVEYNYHIRPILSDRCFKCHGPDARQRKSNFRLDTEEGAFAALKGSPNAHALVPGDPLASDVFRRITSTDTADVMPPPGSNLSLNAHEIALIKKWIEQGAKYQKHWAFIPPVKSTIPDGGADWARNEIDRFVYAAM